MRRRKLRNVAKCDEAFARWQEMPLIDSVPETFELSRPPFQGLPNEGYGRGQEGK